LGWKGKRNIYTEKNECSRLKRSAPQNTSGGDAADLPDAAEVPRKGGRKSLPGENGREVQAQNKPGRLNTVT